jgi:hypothetical protein
MEVTYIKDFNVIKDNFNFINEDEKKYYLEDKKDIKEYILKNYDEKSINNYFIRYYEIINEYMMENTDLMITMNNKKWFVVLFKNGLYFEDIFNINDIIFINIKMISEINKRDINNNFLTCLAVSKLNTLYYNNLNYCINNFNMKERNVKFLNKKNYKFDNEIIEIKNFSLNYLKDYTFIYNIGNEYYTSKNKILKSTENYCPYYEDEIYKLDVKSNIFYKVDDEYIYLENPIIYELRSLTENIVNFY